MKKLTFIFLVIFNCFSFAQKDKNIVPLKLNLPKNELEPKKIRFEKNEILIDDKKCFNYELFHDVEVNGEQIKNYYEIKSLNGDLLFSEIFRILILKINLLILLHFIY